MTGRKNKKRLPVTDICIIGIATSFIVICSWIAIPASVPFTLQTLGVFLSVSLLGAKRGSIAVIVYILLGAIGIPVFAGLTGSFGVILGPNGGYIIGFLPCAAVTGIAIKALGRKPHMLAISMFAGLLLCYLFGTAWYVAIYSAISNTVTFTSAFTICVVPFILPDIAKIVVAVVCTKLIDKRISL